MTASRQTHHKDVRVSHVKFTEEQDQRILEGTATTPSRDRASDIVEPAGATYSLPVPLLLDHQRDKVVGEVISIVPSHKGLRFRARIFKIPTPGEAKDMVDLAWDLVKHGLRKHVSIGFLASEIEPLPHAGVRFKRWELVELSLVGVPANRDAVIETIKAAPVKTSKVIHRVVKVPAAARKPKPAGLTVKPDPAVMRVVEMARIRTRITEIKKRKKSLQRRWEASWHDQPTSEVLMATINTLEKERVQLIAREEGLRAGTLDPAMPAKEPAPTKSGASWDVRNLPEPRFDAALFDGPSEAREKAFKDFISFHVDRAEATAERSGLDATSAVRLRNFVWLQGQVVAMCAWAYMRIGHVERRLAEIEAKGIKYLGIWQRAQRYAKGAVVTHQGSGWVALREVEGEPPGDGSAWQLFVKRGKDGAA